MRNKIIKYIFSFLLVCILAVPLLPFGSVLAASDYNYLLNTSDFKSFVSFNGANPSIQTSFYSGLNYTGTLYNSNSDSYTSYKVSEYPDYLDHNILLSFNSSSPSVMSARCNIGVDFSHLPFVVGHTYIVDVSFVTLFVTMVSAPSLQDFVFILGNQQAVLSKPVACAKLSGSASSSSNGYWVKFRFSFVYTDAIETLQLAFNNLTYGTSGSTSALYLGIDKNNPFTIREYTAAEQNADAIAGIGADTPGVDASGTNNKINNITDQQQAVEDSYKIDPSETTQQLSTANQFFQSGQFQSAANQVKIWVDRFTNENSIMLIFFVTCLGIGLCVFVIGRGFQHK